MIKFIKKKRVKKIIYPNQKDVFNAFRITELYKLKVVIVGQDPYFSKNQAHGLAFSVPYHCKIPPSLNNIYKELNNDFKKKYIFQHGCLNNWAKQGVFLLNSILTVECDKPKSHYCIGWKMFTDRVISVINVHKDSVIFLLWGKEAQKKCHFINTKKHYVLKSSHPSPLSAYKGFFGCRHFSLTNKILIQNNQAPINWFNL